MSFLLDTHVWVWWNMRPEQLSPRAMATISEAPPSAELYLSAISVWEFCKLLENGRLKVSCDPEAWLDEALQMPNLRLVPLTPRVALKSTTLPQPFHTDPADQILVATARELNATLLTRDRRLLDYPHVRTIW
jgi:PIN domain nuclease of toxin-antitoxin system